MKSNFWMYAGNQEQQETAAALVVFGAEVFRRAKLIRDIDLLKQIRLGLDEQDISALPPPNSHITEFSFEYLMDCVRILIFFENYMKAELIVRNFCVHSINREHPKFKDLAKAQLKRPISIPEIIEMEAFAVNKAEKWIAHPAIKETTLSISTLLSAPEYLKNYQLTKNLIDYLKEINAYRNQLHLHYNVEFKLSEDFINRIEELITFVKLILKRVA